MRLEPTTWGEVGIGDVVCGPSGQNPARIVEERGGWLKAAHPDGSFITTPRPLPTVPVTTLVPDPEEAAALVARVLGGRVVDNP